MLGFLGLIENAANSATSAVTKLAQNTGEGLTKVATEVQKHLYNLSQVLQETHVLERLGEAFANSIFSKGKQCPSKEDFLNALDTVLPQYQQDMSIITTDVKGRLASCFEYATTKFEQKSDSSSPARNPINNQLGQTPKDDILKNMQWGAFAGALTFALAAGPGGAAAGVAIGGSLGAVKAFGNNLLNDVLSQAEKQRIIREAEMQKIN